MTPSPPPGAQAQQGMRTFLLVWLGSTVSMLGSALTGFVLGVWAFRATGSATQYALVPVAGILPAILLSPFGGVLADRWDRRLTMIGCNVAAIAGTAATAALLYAGRLEVWHLYVVSFLMSVVLVVQRPASMGASTVLVPPQQFARAAGMMQFGGAAIRILAPILAGVLLGVVDTAGVLLLDVASFLVILGILLAVRIPRPPAHPHAAPPRGVLADASTGWRYVRERPGIFGLLVYFSVIGVAPAVGMVLATPLVLGFADEVALASVMSAGGVGALLGGLLMSTWGGPKRRFHGIMGSAAVMGVCVMVAGLRASPVNVAVGMFGIGLAGPVMTAAFNAIWQTKTPLHLHGRVFSIITMLAESSFPLALLAAGPAADYLFEPLMRPGGALAGPLGPLLGTGAGRGIGVMYILLGAFVLVATAVASRLPRLRFVEDELGDEVAPHPAHAPSLPTEPTPAPAAT